MLIGKGENDIPTALCTQKNNAYQKAAPFGNMHPA